MGTDQNVLNIPEDAQFRLKFAQSGSGLTLAIEHAKDTILLTQRELMHLTQVAFGIVPYYERKEVFSLSYQKQRLTLKVFVGDQSLQTDFPPNEHTEFSAFVIRRLSQSWQASPSDVLLILEKMHSHLVKLDNISEKLKTTYRYRNEQLASYR